MCGKEPNISHLRIFGCTVYVPISPPQRTSMGNQRKLGIYIYISYESSSILKYLEPWTKMSQYIVDISGVGPSRHDINKRRSIEGKIGKYRSISATYRLWPDISESKLVKVAAVQKNAKKKQKKFILADKSAPLLIF